MPVELRLVVEKADDTYVVTALDDYGAVCSAEAYSERKAINRCLKRLRDIMVEQEFDTVVVRLAEERRGRNHGR